MDNNTNKNSSIGGLWKKEAKTTGNKFLTGKVELGGKTYNIVVFPNTKKEPGSNQPDFRILESQDRPQQQSAPAQTKPATKAKPAPVTVAEEDLL